jgi:hypothetical protein
MDGGIPLKTILEGDEQGEAEKQSKDYDETQERRQEIWDKSRKINSDWQGRKLNK